MMVARASPKVLVYAFCAIVCAAAAATNEGDTAPIPSVQWFAPFMSAGGYCSEATAFVAALDAAGAVVHVEQHGDSVNMEYYNGLPRETQALLERLGSTYASPETSVVVCHSEPGAWDPSYWPTSRCPHPNAKVKIGRTMFETDRLPDNWPGRLNKMDYIWVPTEHMARVCREAGVPDDKLVVIGEPVDTDFFSPEHVSSTGGPVELPGKREGDFAFLSVFKWEERKGWDVLLEAFFTEFSADDAVVLYILTNNYHSDADFDEEVRNAAARVDRSVDTLAPVHVLPHQPQSTLPHLYAAADAFVLPSRGEGWGRPHVEAMSMGLPIIATNWSGPTEFMTRDNSYPLQIDGMTTIESGAFRGHQWAQPSVSHLQELLRHVASHPEEAAGKGLRARQDMVANYSMPAMGERAAAALRAAWDGVRHRENQERIRRRTAGAEL